MKIFRMSEGRLYEGDRVRSSFKGKDYDGVVNYVDFDRNEYEIKFDKWEKFNKWAQNNVSRDMYELLDWMEGMFKLEDLVLLEKGKRWETLESDLELVKGETFILYGNEWDVRLAKRIIHENPRAKQNFNVKSVGYYVRSGAVFTDDNYGGADLNVPIILISTRGEDKSGQFPIDGWHRIKKALEEGIDILPAYILTEEESKSIKI